MIKWLRGLWHKEEDHHTEVMQQTADRFEELRESEQRLEKSKEEQIEGFRLARSLHRINRENHFAERVEQVLRGMGT